VSAGASSVALAVVVGLGATLFMDAWALFAARAFGVPLANYCLIGRWLASMPEGRFVHASIADTTPKRAECAVGWIAHYVTGTVYALVLVAIAPDGWLARPTLWPALLFGIGSVLVPYLVMQPAMGLGIAASKSPRPMPARLRSLMAHTAFGLGLYLAAMGASSLSLSR
jgi:hypothetical protein